MKLKFKINLKDSKIPEQIKVPKRLKGFMGFFDEEFHGQTKPRKGKLGNFIEKKYLKKIYSFEYNKKNKSLKSIDNFPKHIHGVYPEFNLKKGKLTKHGLYTVGWFTGTAGRFLEYEWGFRHFVTFDPLEKQQVLVNKVAYFFKKDGDKSFKPTDESYVWMDLVK